MRQHMVVVVENLFKRFCETRGISEVAQPQRAPRRFVLVTRTNATTGRADFFLAAAGLPGLIQRNVIRQNQGAGGGDLQTVLHRNTAGFQCINLFQQRFW